MNRRLQSIKVSATLSGNLWSGGRAEAETSFQLSALDWSGQLKGSLAKLRDSIGEMHRNRDFSGKPEVSELCLTYRFRTGNFIHAVTVSR